MNADGQEHNDMTHRDFSLLLADAADGVEIDMAVVRGGRSRKTRRWAVVAAAAVMIAGSTASLAVAGLQDCRAETVTGGQKSPHRPRRLWSGM